MRPKKAIFDAYDAIFAEHGLHTNHDRACLRLLFQLVGPGNDPRATLFEKFERLLLRAGIALDVGDDQASVVHHEEQCVDEHSDEAEEEEEEEGESPLQWNNSPRRLERRISFTSIYDVTAEIERLSKHGSRSRASFSKVRIGNLPTQSKPAHMKTAFDAPYRRSPSSQHSHSSQTHHVGEHGLSGQEELYQESLSDYDIPSPAHPKRNADKESERSLAFKVDGDQHHAEGVSPLPFVPVSQTQLIRDSVAFDQGRIRILARKYFSKWYIQAQDRWDQLQEFEAEAVRKDRRTLQRQAFEAWFGAHQRIQQEERTRRFFDSLERRAVHTYDAILKLRAFTHWQQLAIENKLKTEAARKRYLAEKYFNVWHRLTVTQELKVERQSLKAPLQLMRRKAVQHYQNEIESLEKYHANLTKLIFWRWCSAYADHTAPRHRDTTLKRETFFTWSGKTKAHLDQERWAADHYERNLLQKTLQMWTAATHINIAGKQQADVFRERSLQRSYVAHWSKATRSAPLEKGLVRRKDQHILRSAFDLWLLRVRMIFAADHVSMNTAKQHAFTAWNDRLREGALQARIDDRVLAQTMYKWVIAQRAILMTRIREEREKRDVFRRLFVAFREHRRQLVSREAQFNSHHYARLTNSALKCWNVQLKVAGERSRMAVEFYAPKVQQDMLVTWRNRHAEVQKIEAWAKDARFYFVMTKALKHWRTATAEAKKQRANEAYKKVRRQVKMNLARNVLSQWRSRVDRINAIEAQNIRIRQGKDNDLLRNIVSYWSDRTVQVQQALLDATARHDGQLLGQSLNAWIDASRQAKNLEIRADQFYQIHLSDLCSVDLRRISMKAFGIKRRKQDADAMRERHYNKHVRNIFRHWAAQTREVTYQALMQEPSPSVEQEPTDAGYATASGTASQNDPPAHSGGGPGATQRAEDWTAFDADVLDNEDWLPPLDDPPQAISTPMPMPGYLNTPSKRAARAKAMAQLSTTPKITPFAARLRAGMASTPNTGATFTARKDVIGRSALGSNVSTAEGGPEDVG